MNEKRHILIAVCGRTPQVITETAWALTQQRHIGLSEIRVITTREGAHWISEALLRQSDGQFWGFCRDYGIDPASIDFSEETIHVIRGPSGDHLEDIRTSSENEQARDQIFKLVHELAQDSEVCLHGSIAGGRKSMGFLLGSAFHLLGRKHDRLYHVLVAPPEVERPGTSYFYPTPTRQPVLETNPQTGMKTPLKILREGKRGTLCTDDVTVELAEIPFCRLSEIVRFAASGRYDQEALELTQEAINAYAETMRRDHLRASAGETEDPYPKIVGKSQAMRNVKRVIGKVAPTDLRVLITGPTGTGKELVAQAIHDASRCSGGPMKSVNCAAILPNLAPSTLFGHEKGAYTDAKTRRTGLFEQANGGTLFLDEINSLSLDVQGMLLRVLVDGLVTRVGGDTEFGVDVRLISASNRDLEREVSEGRFREDLYARIDQARIALPPLKERASDIRDLAELFLQKYAEKYGKRSRGFTPEAMDALNRHDWPRNIRELESKVETAVALAEDGGFIGIADLFEEQGQGRDRRLVASRRGLEGKLKEMEAAEIREALIRHDGKLTRAARDLGMSRWKLGRKAREYGIRP